MYHQSGFTGFGEDVVALVVLRRPRGLRGRPLVEGVRLAEVAAPGLAGQPDPRGGPQEAVLLARAAAGVAQPGAVAVDAAADGAAPRPVALAVLVGIARVADVAEPPEREEEGRFRVRFGGLSWKGNFTSKLHELSMIRTEVTVSIKRNSGTYL